MPNFHYPSSYNQDSIICFVIVYPVSSKMGCKLDFTLTLYSSRDILGSLISIQNLVYFYKSHMTVFDKTLSHGFTSTVTLY